MKVSGRAFKAYLSSPNTATEVKASAGVKVCFATSVKCYRISSAQIGSHQEGYDGHNDGRNRPDHIEANFDGEISALPMELLVADLIYSLFGLPLPGHVSAVSIDLCDTYLTMRILCSISFIRAVRWSLAFMRLSCAVTTTLDARWFNGKHKIAASSPYSADLPSS